MNACQPSKHLGNGKIVFGREEYDFKKAKINREQEVQKNKLKQGKRRDARCKIGNSTAEII